MDEAYRAALRGWRAEPGSLEAVQALARAARRAGAPLPERLDPERVFPALGELAARTLPRERASGDVLSYYAAWTLLPWGLPVEQEQVRAAIAALAVEEDEEFQLDGRSLPYDCLRVHGIEEIAGLDFRAEGRRVPEAWRELQERFDAALSAFPDVRCFEVVAEFPDDGQREVKSSVTELVVLPALERSFLLVQQLAWL